MPAILRRWIPINARAAEADKPVVVISSTDVALRRGRWVEILSHEDGAITDGATSVLRNHNPDVVVGRIESSSCDGHRMRDGITFAPTGAGQEEEALVRGGFVNGVSVGYSIDEYVRTEEADGTTTIRAVKWTRREISTTPTPADLGSGVEGRSLSGVAVRALDTPADFERMLAGARDVTPSHRSKSSNPAAPAAPPEAHPVKITALQLRTLLTMYALCAAEIAERADKGETFETIETWAKAEDAQRAAKASPDPANLALRVAKTETALALVDLARTHGVALTAEEALGVASREVGLDLILQRKADAETSAPKHSLAGEVRVTTAEADKVRSAAEDALGHRSGNPGKTDGGMRRMRAMEIAKRCAVAMGVPGARDWSDDQAADYAVRAGEFRGRAYGVADFPVILANVARVNIASGFSGAGNTWERWTRRLMVPDTRTGKVGGMTTGRLGRPTSGDEKNPLPSLVLNDAGADLTAAMGGGTIIVTRGALLADAAGEILRQIGKVGLIASDSIEADVFKALLDGTYTAATTLSADLAGAAGAGAAINLGVADFMAKTDPSGKPMNARPRFIIHAPIHATKVWEAINPAVGAADSAFRYLEAIPSAYLASHPDTANESADNWFLAADPARTDGIVVGTVYDVPQVYDMDPGGVAGIGMRLEFPWGVTQVGAYGLQKCKKAAS